ncbi:MAG: DUF1905 domain-containing protein [Phaeodactylibacter sp.]|nr:DUF1905 domain-containing protein [Phaeodactylibacter sp.]MCB9273576.1 DUF1905 domain-containing protein [Lewinellaceae bacterium]
MPTGDAIEFTSVLEDFNSSLWGHHIVVPEAIAQVFLSQGSRRVVCRLNGQVEFQCALMPKGDGSYFININKKLRDKLGLKPGMAIQASLREDDSTYGLPMPEELRELLRQDEEGDRLFHALTPGKQRSLLYIVGSPKTSDTRLRRAIVVIEHLRNNGGKLNFRKLNEGLKQSR